MKSLCRTVFKPYLYLAPSLVVLVSFLLGGFTLALLQSLGYFPAIGADKLTFSFYREVLGSPDFWSSLRFTFYVSFTSTLLSAAAGVYLANYLVRCAPKSKLVSLSYKLPIAVPHLVAALMMVFLFSRGGVLSRFLLKIGVIESISEFPALFYTQNAIGIILIYWWKETPFVAVMVYPVMKHILGKLGEVAATLGATQRQVFYHVVLPLSMPSVISASAITFAYSFGAFEIPYLLGASYPKALPVQAYINYISPQLGERLEAMVINVVITLVCAFLVAVYYLSMRRYLRQWS